MSTPKWEAGHLYLKGDLVQPVQAVGGVSVAITNAGFESGDTAWTKGAGWVVTNAVSAYAGSYTGEFQGAFAGPSVISMATAAACSPGQSITAKVKVNTGGNSVNDAGAAIRLTWLTAADAVIRVDEGNICRGGGNAWFESGVTATAPANAEKVAVGCNAYRNDGTDALWIDNFTWNHVTPTAQEGLIYKAVQDDPGFSDSVEPAWPTTLGVQVVDNEVIWEAVLASRVTYEARPILKSGATEPTWPTTPGAFVVDGTISWECVSRRIEDENCPNTKVVHILAGKVFAVDDDIIRFCATANPLDWTAPEDAGYLPSGLQSANGNGMAVLHQYRGNLGAFNANCFQNWQADPNPAAMAILDQIDGIGSTWPKAAQAVANDLLFLSQRGVRSVGIAAGAENLSAGDVGIPVDVLVQESLRVATANGSKVLSTHYPGAGQYWLAFPDYPPPSLSISGDLPNGPSEEIVSYSYSISGGVKPYVSVVVSAGSLPAGLSLDTDDVATGTVRVVGTRTLAGVYPFTLLATDTDGNPATLEDTSETTATIASEILLDAPILYWKLNEVSSSVVTDYSGFARHGTISGTPTQTSSGLSLTAWEQGVFLAGDPGGSPLDVGVDTGWAMESVVTRTGTGGSAREHICGQWRSPNFGTVPAELNLMSGVSAGKPQGTFTEDDLSGPVTVAGPTAVTDDVRTHLMVVRDPGVAGLGALRIYVNGSQVAANVSFDASQIGCVSNGAGFAVGGTNEVGYFPDSYGFIGKIEHVAVYDQTIAAARVLARAQALGLAP